MDDHQLLGISPLHVAENGIIHEIAVIKEDIPVRFINEIVVHPNSAFPFIYGLVYDREKLISYADSFEDNRNEFRIHLEPVGLMHNGSMMEIPDWLTITILEPEIPISENMPSYFIILVSTTTPPIGSYEVAFRETINGRVFVETMIISVVKVEDYNQIYYWQ